MKNGKLRGEVEASGRLAPADQSTAGEKGLKEKKLKIRVAQKKIISFRFSGLTTGAE